ncbi:MAG: hypothetical protein P9M03_00005 [Candidatus Theseobacter exili]|nr:hypothetical protein [Candidatus Theseobacter exili]
MKTSNEKRKMPKKLFITSWILLLAVLNTANSVLGDNKLELKNTVISIKDFGAIENDGKDDSLFLLRAMKHGIKTDNLAIFFPKGKWRINWDLLLKGEIFKHKLKGSDIHANEIHRRWGFFGVAGMGLWNAPGSVILGKGSLVINTHGVNLTNLTFRGAGDLKPGVIIKRMVYVFQCSFEKYAGVAVQIEHFPYGSSFLQCAFMNNGIGIMLKDTDGSPNNIINFSQCRITLNKIGIDAQLGSCITFHQCYIEANGKYRKKGLKFSALKNKDKIADAGLIVGRKANVTLNDCWREHCLAWINGGSLKIVGQFNSTNASAFSTEQDIAVEDCVSTGELIGIIEPILDSGTTYKGVEYISVGLSTRTANVEKIKKEQVKLEKDSTIPEFHHFVRKYRTNEGGKHVRFYNMGARLRLPWGTPLIKISFPMFFPETSTGPMEYILYYFDAEGKRHKLIYSEGDDLNRGKSLEKGKYWNYTFLTLPRFNRRAEVRGLLLEFTLPKSENEDILLGNPSVKFYDQSNRIDTVNFTPAYGNFLEDKKQFICSPTNMLFDNFFLSNLGSESSGKKESRRLGYIRSKSELSKLTGVSFKKGDVLFVWNQNKGTPVGLSCISAGKGNMAKWVSWGQTGYRETKGTPINYTKPNMIGEEVLDTKNNIWYKSVGLTKSAWVKLNN